ncbi:MAG: AraC family transcriptional regulator [bacterium]
MSLVGKTLWFIESNPSAPQTLNDLADKAGVTAFHLARVFAETTGQPVMRYVWRRRLTRAAEALAYGEASVLTIALDAGYASHEAFGRAFRAEYGLTPTALRRLGAVDNLPLTQPQQPRSRMSKVLTQPTLQTLKSMRIAGLSRNYDMQTRVKIPAQWVDYNEDGTRVPGVASDDYYGVVYNFSDDMATFDYICGQETPANATLPNGFSAVTISGRYARFVSKGHISTINAAWAEVYSDWLSRPDFKPRRGPSVEYYPPAFNGMTGEGGYELWVPLEG